MTSAAHHFFQPAPPGNFSSLHVPTGVASRTGVLCVAPLFGEYIQFHRAFYHLAEQLAGQGIATLRYDHEGTGDSAGDLDAVSVAGWREGIVTAFAALRERADIDRIFLIAARFGAALALEVAPRLSALAGLVCWDPVLDGGAYTDELLTQHHSQLGHYLAVPTDGLPGATGKRDVLGFEIPDALWRDLASTRVDLDLLSPEMDVALIGTREAISQMPVPPGYERVTRRAVTYPPSWGFPEDGIFDVLTPLDTVTEIRNWVTRRA